MWLSIYLNVVIALQFTIMSILFYYIVNGKAYMCEWNVLFLEKN